MKRNFGTMFTRPIKFLFLLFILLSPSVSFPQKNNPVMTTEDSVINRKSNEEFELKLHNKLDGYSWYLGVYDTAWVKFNGKSKESIQYESQKGSKCFFSLAR